MKEYKQGLRRFSATLSILKVHVINNTLTITLNLVERQ